MEMNIDDAQLLTYLLKFLTGRLIQCDQIRLLDLYGDKKPSQLFDTTATTYHYVITQLKKRKAGKGNNFIRAIVGGDGSWKITGISRPVYDKRKSEVGFQKTFRFDEQNQSWHMKEYHLSDEILENLRRRGQIRYEGVFVVCRIWRNVNAYHIRQNFLASSSSQRQETVKSFAQENQDLGEFSAAAIISSDELNSILNWNICQVCLLTKESNVIQLPASIDEESSVTAVHQETPFVSLLANESNVPASIDEESSVTEVHQETRPSVSFIVEESNVPAEIEEECSVPVDHQENPSVSLLAKESNVAAAKEEEEFSVCPDYDIATYHKELDAYAASILETMVPYILEPQEDEDEIPLFCQDFYIGHTNLWS